MSDEDEKAIDGENVVDIVKAKKSRAKARAREAEAARAASAAEKQRPEKTTGRPAEGVPPGMWSPDPVTGLPPNCPVQALGMDGDTLHLVDALGQHSAVAPNSFGQNYAQRLFLGYSQEYLHWAWPRFDKEGKVAGFDTTKLRADMYSAAARRGLWDSIEHIRGLGAWTDEKGRLVWHAGDHLWVDGRPVELGSHGRYFYPRRPTGVQPAPERITEADNPAPLVFRALQTWNWERPRVDSLLMLGWIGVAFIGGALIWRPSIFLLGDKGIGKSTLQALIAAILGRQVVSTPNTTAAGIYQKVRQDSVAVAVDELEASDDNRKVMQVVELARLASSGGVMLRGGSDHTGVAFQARSPFLFSAINPPPLKPQDRSRMAILSVDKLDPSKVAAAPVLKESEKIGPRLLRRMLDAWDQFDRLRGWYGEALRQGGHDARGLDTFGTLLTCAHMLLGDEGMDAAGYPIESADFWTEALRREDEGDDNWRMCLTHLLSVPVEAWRSGTMPTIGRLLERVMDPHDTLLISDAQNQLAAAGCGMVERGKVCPGPALAIPHHSPIVSRLFAGKPWADGVWRSALRQEKSRGIVLDTTQNRVRISGVQQRCTLIDVVKLLAMT